MPGLPSAVSGVDGPGRPLHPPARHDFSPFRRPCPTPQRSDFRVDIIFRLPIGLVQQYCAAVARRPAMTHKEKPWLFRTYAGHSTAAKSNAL
ncbi:MAG: hypothetical protein ACK414_05560, partial [Gemmobacter sp.]